MKVKEITVSYKETRNLGNYNNVSAEASITVEVEEDESVQGIFTAAWLEAKDQVEKTIKEAR